ncbi:MAG: hypothetical protein N3A65_10065 [candidate division WOR-3 bacterium]|nr:hypothetical protein [candidate division WOR-3 bacterium]
MVRFINSQVGFVAGYCGMIRKTTNGGSVWIAEEKEEKNLNVDIHNQRLWAYPNPFRSKLNIRYRIQDTGYKTEKTTAGIEIYDATGRFVKSFNPASCILNLESPSLLRRTEQASIVWFGDDNSGRELPAGVYFIVPEDKSLPPVRVVKIR